MFEAIRRDTPPQKIPFRMHSDFSPSGDQPTAIKSLCKGIEEGEENQVLLGVTGSGKTYTMAKIIEQTQKSALILAPNKTLAAQLYAEFKKFFPENAVEYFVSYYDFYQPEAYVARTDTFIEKDSQINEHIDLMRHSATQSLLSRGDTIVVASISCIYGLGSPESYEETAIGLKVGDEIDRDSLLKNLSELQYRRNDIDFQRGTMRARGDIVDIWAPHLEDKAWRIRFFGDEIESISFFDPITGSMIKSLEYIKVFSVTHHISTRPQLIKAIDSIKSELKDRLKFFEKNQKLVEHQRLKERTEYDIESLIATGMCKGIENYSRYFSNRESGSPPPTLFEYLPTDSLLFVDESHVTVPQIHGMSKGDSSRKQNLSEFGWRLPSCLDNRPLKFDEWLHLKPKTIYVSATPSAYEVELSNGKIAEQIIRPTGLIDPPVEIKPILGQVEDVVREAKIAKEHNGRSMVVTLTKKMAEDLTEYLIESGLSVKYIHSDVDTLERIEILRDLRLGSFDVLVGINLLREGLDIPECRFMAILDADKEGFLRSATSLIQTIGRAARNKDAKVILYADRETDSMKRAILETNRRREIQIKHNKDHGITPKTVVSPVMDVLAELGAKKEEKKKKFEAGEFTVAELRAMMKKAAGDLNFELAASLRDQANALEKKMLGI